jgi:SAM-dependent methyltransferase
MYKELIGLDISDIALERAAHEASLVNAPSRYVTADLNGPLPQEADGKFDLIYAIASLHHIENLEGLFSQLADRLADDGAFFYLEYCGPSRLQWRDRVMRISNAILEILPPELKGEFERVTRPGYDIFVNHDPSESIRSAELVDLTHLFFDIVVVQKIGFTITQPLLNPILRHFDDNNPLHTAIYRLIFLLEEILIDHDIIEADTKVVVARKKSA